MDSTVVGVRTTCRGRSRAVEPSPHQARRTVAISMRRRGAAALREA
ncbi:hypothetical protein [Gordonia sp. MP11Mi]